MYPAQDATRVKPAMLKPTKPPHRVSATPTKKEKELQESYDKYLERQRKHEVHKRWAQKTIQYLSGSDKPAQTADEIRAQLALAAVQQFIIGKAFRAGRFLHRGAKATIKAYKQGNLTSRQVQQNMQNMPTVAPTIKRKIKRWAVEEIVGNQVM